MEGGYVEMTFEEVEDDVLHRSPDHCIRVIVEPHSLCHQGKPTVSLLALIVKKCKSELHCM